jgi:arylsulfatase A-like enzyme
MALPKDKEERKRSALTIAVYILILLGAVFFAGALLVWFTNTSYTWKVLGIKIKLRFWEQPWWYAILLWTIAVWISKRPPFPVRPVLNIFSKAAKLIDVPFEDEKSGWGATGAFFGALSGFFFVYHYFYILPNLGLRIFFVPVISVSFMLIHYLFFYSTQKLFESIRPEADWWEYMSGRIIIYSIIWSGIITGPLRLWEARGTEFGYGLICVAFLVGILVTWFVTKKKSTQKIQRAALAVTAASVIIAGIYSFVTENNKIKTEDPPNNRVIIITMDTTRADYLSCYGYPKKTTPNLDKLAENGVMFSKTFCEITITDPSHASIMTGAYPRTHGLVYNYQSITGNVDSMASYFLDKGFNTAAITSREHVMPSILNIDGFIDMNSPNSWMARTSAHETFRRVANHMIKHRDEDIFMWIHFFDPHKSYEYHKGYSHHFVEKNEGARWGQSFMKPKKSYSPEEIKYKQDLYAGEIFYMDHWIGKIIDMAQNLEPKPKNPPFIVVTADHGEAMGEYQGHDIHYGFGHGLNLYNGVSHVPLIISWPGKIPKGLVIDDITESVDIAPTMVEYVLGKTNYKAQGQSLMPVINQVERTDQTAFLERNKTDGRPARVNLKLDQFGVIKGNMKLLIENDQFIELYNMDDDWGEKNNLAKQEKETVKELLEELKNWKEITPHTIQERKKLTPEEIRSLKALGYIQ